MGSVVDPASTVSVNMSLSSPSGCATVGTIVVSASIVNVHTVDAMLLECCVGVPGSSGVVPGTGPASGFVPGGRSGSADSWSLPRAVVGSVVVNARRGTPASLELSLLE